MIIEVLKMEVEGSTGSPIHRVSSHTAVGIVEDQYSSDPCQWSV